MPLLYLKNILLHISWCMGFWVIHLYHKQLIPYSVYLYEPFVRKTINLGSSRDYYFNCKYLQYNLCVGIRYRLDIPLNIVFLYLKILIYYIKLRSLAYNSISISVAHSWLPSLPRPLHSRFLKMYPSNRKIIF